MESYEDILQRMEQAYEEAGGHAAEDVSDTGLRLRVLAGELYRLRAEVAWLEKQAFPHTASGEWLDRHGAQRGVARREAVRARGKVTFSRYLPISFDVVIPKGTVCASPGDEPVEYETLEDGVMAAGNLTVEVPAQAVLGGAAGNAAAGRVNTLVASVSGVDYVTNKKPFTGGREREKDEEYRPRVLDAYANLPSGSNAAYYRDAALSVAGVSAAGVKPRISGPNTVGVFLWGEDGPPDETVLAAVKQELEKRREIGVTVTVQAAEAYGVNVGMRLKMKAGTDSARARGEVAEALRLYLNGLPLGSPVYKADLERVVLESAPVTEMEMSATVRDMEGDSGVIPVAGNISVEEIV